MFIIDNINKLKLTNKVRDQISHKHMRQRSYYIFLMCSLFFFSSCHKEKEEDIFLSDPAPVTIEFYVLDSEGNDLLDPENPNAFGPEDITIICTEHMDTGEATYHVGAYNGNPERKQWFDVVVAPYFIANKPTETKYVISIGNYYSQYLANMPAKNVVIEWPDGSKDYIVLTYSDFRFPNGLLFQDVHIYLNGEDVSSPHPFTIVK